MDTSREAADQNTDAAGAPERFGLSWPGKRAAARLASDAPSGILVAEPSRSRAWETTRHVFVEGDNLDALKLWQAELVGQVKLIYIDPPYNTGNAFTYPDAFALRHHAKSDAGADAGQRHARWLSMLYPRLLLARTLLRSDGAIFVSIDDHEHHTLRLLLDEVFDARNFVATLVWKGRGGRQASAHLAALHEYILLYARDKSAFTAGRMPRAGDTYPQRDPRSGRRYKTRLARKWGNDSRRDDRPRLYYPVTAPDGSGLYPMRSDGTPGRWRWGLERMAAALAAGDLEFVRSGEGWQLYEKVYEPPAGTRAYQRYSTWLDDAGTTADGTAEMCALLGDEGEPPFTYPKPTALLRRLLRIADTSGDDLILDFFAGSGTTGHAVLQMNREEGGQRRYVLVQSSEPTGDPRYPAISDLTRARLAAAADHLHATNPTPNQAPHPGDEDLGFRSYRVSAPPPAL
ncbi:MAG TPA: site-specific DNA-methyltransferase [Ktedonobacterales bacterium]|nr:site-specific DNA-methyltransferase [Ktedonobacterales bacterium]